MVYWWPKLIHEHSWGGEGLILLKIVPSLLWTSHAFDSVCHDTNLLGCWELRTALEVGSYLPQLCSSRSAYRNSACVCVRVWILVYLMKPGLGEQFGCWVCCISLPRNCLLFSFPVSLGVNQVWWREKEGGRLASYVPITYGIWTSVCVCVGGGGGANQLSFAELCYWDGGAPLGESAGFHSSRTPL